MKKMLFAALVVSWSTLAFAAGSGSGAETSWVGKTGAEFLTSLPSPPGNVCLADDEAIKQFNEKYFPVRKDLDSKVVERRRSLKRWQEKNSRKMMENAVDMPGFEGKSQAEMKKMSKAERKKMAEQMMADKFGVSMADLKAQKKANKEGKTMANVDWAKSMAGEMQANDLMKSKEQRETDKRKLADVGKLLKEQGELIPSVQGLRSRSLTKLSELEKDPQWLELKKQVEREKKKLDEMASDPNFNCNDLNAQHDRLVSTQQHYCSFYASRYLKILNDYRVSIQTSLPKHDRLDQVASDLQQAQAGIPLSDASLGLSGLETVQDYAHLLGQVYKHNVGPMEKTRGHFCDGEEGSVSF
jgi:hypothetical protein